MEDRSEDDGMREGPPLKKHKPAMMIDDHGMEAETDSLPEGPPLKKHKPEETSNESSEMVVEVRWALSGEQLATVRVPAASTVAHLYEVLNNYNNYNNSNNNCSNNSNNSQATGQASRLQAMLGGRLLERFELLGSLGPSGGLAAVEVVRCRSPVVLASSESFLASVWNAESGKRFRAIPSPDEGAQSSCFSSDGSLGLVGYSNGLSKVFLLATGECTQTLTARCGSVLSVSLSSCGQQGITGNLNGTAKLWRVSDGSCVATFARHSGPVHAVALSPDSQVAVTGSGDETAKVWCTQTGNCMQTLQGHAGIVLSVALTPDSTFAVTGSFDGCAKLWSIATGCCERTFAGHHSAVTALAVCPHQDLLVTGSFDGNWKVWHLNSGLCRDTFAGHNNNYTNNNSDKIRSVCISPDGANVLFGSPNGSCKLCNLKTREFLRSFSIEGGRLLAVGLCYPS
ncbi:unnamed protein product [Polarella glacialis]|uniref:Guanine nucleotide-binding protein subunit beta-like protein n=1 Tax=Polarella glacialis TaxID=89957 RepID=A0A813EV88_POLGL|nr:unnamed protein product [Polarella glacialis]CAE8729654.1 unnamed protein product [Polarella glacialis]